MCVYGHVLTFTLLGLGISPSVTQSPSPDTRTIIRPTKHPSLAWSRLKTRQNGSSSSATPKQQPITSCSMCNFIKEKKRTLRLLSSLLLLQPGPSQSRHVST
ncbi:hypothetical protein V8C44DRAFT_168150 [Trichoderma aethiopicum]